MVFQYRKRYEITCDKAAVAAKFAAVEFQYRKRYEITCDICTEADSFRFLLVSIPQAV